jgi:hypothetical protein
MEVNSDVEGGNSTQIMVPDNNMRGTMYNALYMAEFLGRAASQQVQYTNHVAVQGLYGNYFALINGAQDPVYRAELQYGPIAEFGGSTVNADYGLFFSPEGLAVMLAAGAINTSTQNLYVTQTYGAGAERLTLWHGICGSTPCSGTSTAATAQARAWRDSASPSNYHLLLTNRGANAALVLPQVDGNGTLGQGPTIS